MLNITSELLKHYVTFLEKRTVPSSLHNGYQKWLRFYLDYCAKYRFPEGGSKSLTQFFGKLREKKQTDGQIRQAGHAVTLYHDFQRGLKPAPSFIRAVKPDSPVQKNADLLHLNSTAYINKTHCKRIKRHFVFHAAHGSVFQLLLILIISCTGPFSRNHAGADRAVRAADRAKEFAFGRGLDPE